jgi:hypothetical protein
VPNRQDAPGNYGLLVSASLSVDRIAAARPNYANSAGSEPVEAIPAIKLAEPLSYVDSMSLIVDCRFAIGK